MLTEEKLDEVYEKLKPRKVKFAFDACSISADDYPEWDTVGLIFEAYAIDSRRWIYDDSNGVRHNGWTFIMPDYFTFESLWDFEYVDEHLPYEGLANYLCPEEIWKDATKFNVAKRN